MGWELLTLLDAHPWPPGLPVLCSAPRHSSPWEVQEEEQATGGSWELAFVTGSLRVRSFLELPLLLLGCDPLRQCPGQSFSFPGSYPPVGAVKGSGPSLVTWKSVWDLRCHIATSSTIFFIGALPCWVPLRRCCLSMITFDYCSDGSQGQCEDLSSRDFLSCSV